MLIDKLVVLKLRRSYVLLEAGPYRHQGFNGVAPTLKAYAAGALELCFGFDVDADDVRLAVVSVEGEEGAYRFIYRATWEPDQLLVRLNGGPEDGREYTLPYPMPTVTIRHGMGSYEESMPDEYRFTGFDTGSRRFIFDYQE